MTSRYWRTIASNFVLGTIIEYAVCICISLYFNNDNHLFYALLIMLALWAVQVALWLKNLIVGTIQYYLTGRRRWICEVETVFRQNQFPIYDDFTPDAVDYLATVIKDERASTDQLTFAAASLGQIELVRTMKPIGAFRMMSVVERALDNYRRNPVGAYPGITRKRHYA